MTRKKQWFLVDVWRRRVDYPALKAAVLSQAKAWSPARVLVEDAGAGTSLVQELNRQGVGDHRREAGGRQGESHGGRFGQV